MRVLRISHSAVVSAWRERERQMIASGVDTRLLTAKEWNEGGSVVPLVPGPDTFVSGVRTVGTHPILFLYDPRPIWRALRQHWDVIDIHEEPYSLAAAEVLLIKTILRQRAPYVLYSAQNIEKRYPVPIRWMERAALRAAGAVSVCNHEAGAIAMRKGLGGFDVYIPLGVDTSMFSPAVGRDRPDMDGPVRVGYVGRLAAHKGVDVLLQAVATRPRLHLTIVGAGPADVRLRKLAHELGLEGRVEFAGARTQEELSALYRSFDVVAVPSLPTSRWLEQFCRVAIEAMAAGVPVVASSSGALSEVVGDAGLLVPPGDSTALAAAILSAGTDPVIRTRLVAAGLERARSFSWPNVSDMHVKLYRRLAADRSDRPPTQVLVVAYGSPEMLRESLAPLLGKYPLLVVDNSSSPEIAALTAEMRGRYLDPGANLGFAAAVNLGLAAIGDSGSDVLLLNPDAVISADSVEKLSLHLNASRRTASVGPAQADSSGEPARVLWPFPSPWRSWLQAVGLGAVPARHRFVIGSVLLIKRRALQNVGGFDERFFLYAEEADWAYRAHRAGWRHELVPSVTALHHGAGTSTDPVRRELLFHSSQERYLRKHYGALGWAAARTATICGAAVRSLMLPPSRAAENRRRLRLYLVGPIRAAARMDTNR